MVQKKTQNSNNAKRKKFLSIFLLTLSPQKVLQGPFEQVEVTGICKIKCTFFFFESMKIMIARFRTRPAFRGTCTKIRIIKTVTVNKASTGQQLLSLC